MQGDLQRWAPEPAKRDQSLATIAGIAPVSVSMPRTEFTRDRARVLHSSAFRRLADKTQVVSPGQDDFPRTRMTHSLEVAQIAREIGSQLGCDPDVTDTAGLAHDLGHPPFGHNGEQALNAAAASIGGFEGNAQTFRILTRLEPKILGEHGSAGLNLTRAVLDATCKYPWRFEPARGSKFGVYQPDLAAFRWLRAGQPDGRRCLEAQVMDWADDVAYSVHDVEDGVHAGFIRLARLADSERVALCQDAAEHYWADSAAELQPVLADMLDSPALRDLAAFDGSFGSLAAVKRATSELTGRFAGAAVVSTRQQFGAGPLLRYGADLKVPDVIVGECALLKAMALRYVMRRPGVEQLLQRQRQMLTQLVAAVHTAGAGELSPLLEPVWRACKSDEQRLRVAVDQVAQLTDSAAVSWHRRLCA